MKLSCAIIDDEPLALELLESYVNKTPFLLLKGRYNSAVEAMTGLAETPVDIIFLDIQMPELDGLQFSKMIPESSRIVFTTAFQQYALEGYRVNALDYLMKPISYNDFIESANKALKWFELMRKTEKNEDSLFGETPFTGDSIYVKSEHKLIRIELNKVLYFEGFKDYIRIFLEKEEKPIYSLMSLKILEEKLSSSRFLRIHRSYIVQVDKIRMMESESLVVGHKHIPISKNYKKDIQKYLEERTVNGKREG